MRNSNPNPFTGETTEDGVAEFVLQQLFDLIQGQCPESAGAVLRDLLIHILATPPQTPLLEAIRGMLVAYGFNLGLFGLQEK